MVCWQRGQNVNQLGSTVILPSKDRRRSSQQLRLFLTLVSFSLYLASMVVSGLVESHTPNALTVSFTHLKSFSGARSRRGGGGLLPYKRLMGMFLKNKYISVILAFVVCSIKLQGRSQTSEQDEASFERRRREPLGGCGGMPPPENFEI